MREPLLRRFLGVDQIERLFAALDHQSASAPPANLSTFKVALAILIAALPMLSFYMDSQGSNTDFNTLFVGVSACLAIVYRIRSGIPFNSVKEWRKSLRLTHVAFALGCVPAVLIFAFLPEALAPLTAPTVAPGPQAPPVPISKILSFILGVAVWAAMTEEFIFRGMLISVLRRWNAFSKAGVRDSVAIIVAALLFGLAHLQSWGPIMSLALFGLGLGLGIAYVAIGELILPLIVYHLIFDALSLTYAVATHRL